HGAHFVPGTQMPESAAEYADVVVHSLHKTLPALTQTGLLHVGRNSILDADALRSSLRLLQSSSPSYLLMASIEQALRQLDSDNATQSLQRLAQQSRQIADTVRGLPGLELYEPPAGCDPAHILVGCPGRQPEVLYNYLSDRGIFAETVLGNGVLFMLGLGT